MISSPRRRRVGLQITPYPLIELFGFFQRLALTQAHAWIAAREVCSAKWVIDDYTFDLTSMAHVLGEQLAATECARGGYNRRIPIG